MAVCLEYQAVYCSRKDHAVSLRTQIAAALFLLIVLCSKVWVKVESVDLGYQLARERNTAVALDMERRELELQLSVLLRADNLAHRAAARLGLQPLNGRQAVKIRY